METIITILLWVALVPVSGVLLAIGIDIWTDNLTYLANKIRWYRATPSIKRSSRAN